MRLLLALLLVAGLLLATLWLAQRPGTRGGHALAVGTGVSNPEEPIEDELPVEGRAAVTAPEPELASTIEPPASDDFPRSALTGTVVWRDNTPATGIAIEIRAVAQRETARPLASPTSEDGGGFAVVVPGEGPFAVRAFARSGGGTRVEFVRQPVEAGTTQLLLVLPRTARLQGRVLDDRGAPVEEFTLLLRRWESPDEAPLRATFRQSDGSFETEELECDRWAGTITAPGFGPAELSSISLPLERPLEVRLVRASRVQGVVRDELGSPAQGVRVGVMGLEGWSVSDAEGAFDLECRCGTVVVGILDTTRATGPPLTFELQPGELRTGLVLRVKAAGTVLGRVLTLGARPAAGRDVWLVSRGTPSARGDESEAIPCLTDRDGAFHAALAPGAWEARVELTHEELAALREAADSEPEAEHPFVAESFSITAHETTRVSILLGPAPVHLRGMLTKAGEPCSGGALTARDVQTGLVAEAHVAGSSYGLSLPRAGPHLFELTFGRTARLLLLDVPGEGSSTYDLDLPVGWIDGRVRTRAGDPASGVKVLASAAPGANVSGGSAFAITEPDGTFSIEVAPGQYTVAAGELGGRPYSWGWGRKEGLQVQEGVRLKGLELVTLGDEALFSLEVDVLEPSGALVRDSRVLLKRADWGDAVITQDAPEGTAHFFQLSGDFRIEAEAPGHRQLEERSVRLRRGPPARAQIVLTPVHEVLVTFRAGDSTTIPSDLDAVDTVGRVYPALRVDPEDEPAGTSGERRFRFAALPEGPFLLRAFAGPDVEEHRVDVPPGAREPFRIELGGN